MTAPAPRRRLADRLLASGATVARQYADLDRWDPVRPSLGMLVAETLAQHERIGEERVLTRLRALVEQRTALRDERLRIVQQRIDGGLLGPASTELRWAADLDEQIGALRLLLADSAPGTAAADEPAEAPRHKLPEAVREPDPWE